MEQQQVAIEVAGLSCPLAEFLQANADDAEVCEWARTAKPGDVWEEAHSERAVAVAA